VRLLVTRPRPEAERAAAILRAKGHTVVIAPLSRIEAVTDANIGAGSWAAILVTSANAAPVIAAHPQFPILRTLPVFAVGHRSAEAMREAGFAEVTSADGDVGDLARLVAERLPRGAALLYLAGADRAGDLAGDLAARGFVVDTVVVYRAIGATSFAPDAVQAITTGIDGVLHYSPRSAAAYVAAARAGDLVAAGLLKPAQFCLSANVAAPLAQAGAADIRIAAQAAEAALIALIPPP
jgi:uroporphyrinogen-III synthase